MDKTKNSHLNDMQERPDMLETINLRVLQDLQEDGTITLSQLKRFEKLASDKGNEHVIKYFNDFDNRLNNHGFSSNSIRSAIVGLLKNKGYNGESTYTALKHSVLGFLYELISSVEGQTDEVVQKTEKHAKNMNIARTKEKKEKEVKIDNLKEKLNEGVRLQKLEDMLSFLKPMKEGVKFDTQAQKAADLMSKPGKMMEAITLSKSLKKPERREFTKEEEKKFIVARAQLAEQLGYKVFKNQGKWFGIENEKYWISMQHFMMPCPFGYKNGRISEISVIDQKNEDNEIEFHSGDKITGMRNTELRKILDEIAKYFN